MPLEETFVHAMQAHAMRVTQNSNLGDVVTTDDGTLCVRNRLMATLIVPELYAASDASALLKCLPLEETYASGESYLITNYVNLSRDVDSAGSVKFVLDMDTVAFGNDQTSISNVQERLRSTIARTFKVSSLTTLSDTCTSDDYCWTTSTDYCTTSILSSGEFRMMPVEMTPTEQLRARIRQNLRGIPCERKYLNHVKNDDPEFKARGLLRDMIGEIAFRDYLKKGFITAQGRSGIFYQIMRGHGTRCIRSFCKTKTGSYKPFENICVVFKDDRLPPTDAVIMRLMMCLHDEFGMRAVANVSPANGTWDENEEYELGEYGQLALARKNSTNDYITIAQANQNILLGRVG